MDASNGGSAGLVSHVETSPVVDYQELDALLPDQGAQQARPISETMAQKGHQLAPGAPAFVLQPSAASAKPAADSQQGLKQQICFDFTKNQCSRGASCKFSHNVELIIQVNSQEKGICFDFLKGMCSRGALCRFSHDLNNLQVPPSLITNPPGTTDPSAVAASTAAISQPHVAQASTVPRRPNAPICYDFVKSQCTRGDDCKYSHDYSSILNGPRTGQKNPYVVCVDFTRGRCTRGAACRYLHGAPLGVGVGGVSGGLYGPGSLPMGGYSPLAASLAAAALDPAILAATMARMQSGGGGGGGALLYGPGGVHGAGGFNPQHQQYLGQMPLPNMLTSQAQTHAQAHHQQQDDTIRAAWGDGGGGGHGHGVSGYHAEYAALLQELQNTTMSSTSAVAPHHMVNESLAALLSADGAVSDGTTAQHSGDSDIMSLLLLQQELLQQQQQKQQQQHGASIHDDGNALPQNKVAPGSGVGTGTGTGAGTGTAQRPRVPFHHHGGSNGGNGGFSAVQYSKMRAENMGSENQGTDSPTIRASWGELAASTQTQELLQTPAGLESLSLSTEESPALQSYGSPFGGNGDASPGFEALKSIWSKK